MPVEILIDLNFLLGLRQTQCQSLRSIQYLLLEYILLQN